MSLSIGPTIKVYWRHVRRYPVALAFLLIVLVALNLLNLVPALLNKQFFDAFTTGQTGADLASTLISVLVWIVGVNFGLWLLQRCADVTNNFIQPRVIIDLEQTAFEHLLDHSYRFFTDNFAGSLVKKIHRFGRAFERIMDQIIWKLVQIFISIIGTIVIFYLRSPLFAAILSGWAVLFVVVNIIVARWKLKYDLVRAELDTESGGKLADAVSNATTIQQFVGKKFEAARFWEVNSRWRKMVSFTWNLGSVNDGVQAGFMFALQGVAMYVAINLYVQGKMTLGDFALIQTALVALFMRLYDFGRVIRDLYDGFADAKEMVDVLELPFEITDKRGAKKLLVKKGEISFKNVSFGYNLDRPIMEDMNLDIKAREKIAFVGPSGAGKSTVIKLLMRFFDVTKGSITIDGQDISKVTQDSLRSLVSLVPQDSLLFHRTIMENIRYGRREASDKEVIAASKKAHCHEFIAELPLGYSTKVGERGVKLSGGERQRVAIARAILKNSPILVLDEATSSLDSESEALIQDALSELMKSKTVIVIAHRLSTIMQMDRIVVIEKGDVIDAGTHAELIKHEGTYKKLWSIQAGGFLP
ncbi:TPA: ABC transporter ATP-binding protein [Candidatus Uhrbacteria bacterium]|nr:ABC transporter ATP-binding protein [Candidatus Uhrbacteria bacterium]